MEEVLKLLGIDEKKKQELLDFHNKNYKIGMKGYFENSYSCDCWHEGGYGMETIFHQCFLHKLMDHLEIEYTFDFLEVHEFDKYIKNSLNNKKT